MDALLESRDVGSLSAPISRSGGCTGEQITSLLEPRSRSAPLRMGRVDPLVLALGKGGMR
jgi:hypothetical protein